MEIAEHIKQFIISVRTRARQDESITPASPKSVGYLAGLLNDKHNGIQHPENRHKVLQAITGLPVKSGYALTQWYVSVIIDEVLNVFRTNPTTLKDIEGLLENRDLPEGNPWELFPWERPGIDLFVL